MLQHRYRYLVLFLGWLCLTSISSNMMALNFTLICMSKPATEDVAPHDEIFESSSPIPNIMGNSSQIPEKDGHLRKPNADFIFEYTQNQKTWLMWMVGIGSLLGTFPFSWLCTHYGARYVLLGAGLLSAVSTALIPWAAFQDFNLFLFFRFLQGVAYSADFATIGMICSRWASLKQYAFFISVLTCFTPLSTTVTNSASGMICESFGWPMVYYLHAAVCVVLFILWVLIYHDHPKSVRLVSQVELEKINRNKTKAHIEMNKFVPYKEIIFDKLIWTVWLNAFADIFTAIFTLMYIPSYFKFVLNYGVKETGFLGALPTLLTIPTRILFGYGSDAFKCISERAKLIVFNTTAVAIPGLFFLGIGYIPSSFPPITVVLMFTTMHLFFSVSGAGFYKCAALYSRQYYHFVIANIQFVKCLSLFIGPLMMSIFVRDETDRNQWRSIFILFSFLLLIANTLFCWLCSDKQAEFTKHSVPVEKPKPKVDSPLKATTQRQYLSNV